MYLVNYMLEPGEMREYIIHKVKKPIMKALLTLSKRYPEPKRDEILHPNTLKLMDIRDKFFEYEDNPGRNALFEAVFRVPNGFDIEAIQKDSDINPIAGNYRLYGNCLKSWNNEKVFMVPAFFDDQEEDIISAVEQGFVDLVPGVNMAQDITCDICGSKSILDFANSDFLFQLPKRGRRETQS